MTTAALLAMIARAKNRNEAARAYREGLIHHHYRSHGIDWPDVNAAIVERWGERGLAQIRCFAWKMERGEA